MTMRVLWIDDKYHKDHPLLESAYNYGIDILGYTNVKGGMDYLESNPDDVDALILDAMTYENETDTIPSMKGLYTAYKRVTRFNAKNPIPCFIYSGQKGVVDGEVDHLDFPTFNKKNSIELLFKAIKKAVENQPENKIRIKHQQVFNVLNPKYLGRKTERYILDCLLQIEELTFGLNQDNEDFLNRLRKTLEALFKCLNKRKILPDAFVKKDRVSLAYSNKFMSGESIEVDGVLYSLAEDAVFPPAIANSISTIIHRTNFASHHNEPDFDEADARINEAELKEYKISPYLLHSLTFQVMDILCWIKHYIDRYSTAEANESLVSTRPATPQPQIIGPLEQKKGTYHVKNCWIPPKFIKEHELKLEQEVTILKYSDNTNDNGFRYFCHILKK